MEQTRAPMYERLRQYIDEVAGLSRKLVAINAGLTESKLSLLLSGKRRLSVDEFEGICNAISVSPTRFF